MALTIRQKRTVAAGIALVITAVIIIYASVDPESSQWFPRCVFHDLTGLKCPSCGNQRALHALLEGRIIDAFCYNFFIIISIPVAVATAIYYAAPASKLTMMLRATVLSRIGLILYVGLFVGWWIVRNVIGI